MPINAPDLIYSFYAELRKENITFFSLDFVEEWLYINYPNMHRLDYTFYLGLIKRRATNTSKGGYVPDYEKVQRICPFFEIRYEKENPSKEKPKK